jgi:hypothetical protein
MTTAPHKLQMRSTQHQRLLSVIYQQHRRRPFQQYAARANWAALYKFGKSRTVTAGANRYRRARGEAQRIALETIVSGEACAPWQFLLRLRIHLLGVLRDLVPAD